MSNGIQNNTIQSIDVVYTKLGRLYKSLGSPLSIPTKVAFSDDGVDYNLYDINLPENERGLKIERMPQFDAWTNGLALMRNKLITLPRQTVDSISSFYFSHVGDINIEVDINLPVQNIIQPISLTANFPSVNGFDVTISDTTYLYINEPPRNNRYTQFLNGSQMFAAQYGTYGTYGNTIPMTSVQNTSGTNLLSQTVGVAGGTQRVNTSQFNIIYNSQYNRFNNNTPHTVTITVNSLSTGEVQSFNVNLSKKQ